MEMTTLKFSLKTKCKNMFRILSIKSTDVIITIRNNGAFNSGVSIKVKIVYFFVFFSFVLNLPKVTRLSVVCSPNSNRKYKRTICLKIL